MEPDARVKTAESVELPTDFVGVLLTRGLYLKITGYQSWKTFMVVRKAR